MKCLLWMSHTSGFSVVSDMRGLISHLRARGPGVSRMVLVARIIRRLGHVPEG